MGWGWGYTYIHVCIIYFDCFITLQNLSSSKRGQQQHQDLSGNEEAHYEKRDEV